MEQRTGRQQVALVEHALRQRVGIHPGFHPTEQAGRWCGEAAAVGQRPFQQGRGRQRGQQLGVDKGLYQLWWRGQKTHPPTRCQDLGKTTHVNGSLQAVERAQARGVVGRDVAVGVVFDNVEAVGIERRIELQWGERGRARVTAFWKPIESLVRSRRSTSLPCPFRVLARRQSSRSIFHQK